MSLPLVPQNPDELVQLSAKDYAKLIATLPTADDLTENQLHELQKETPKAVIMQSTEIRGASASKPIAYIPHGYFTRRLNTIFRNKWSFEIVREWIMLEQKQVIVLGRLKVLLSNGIVISKDQYGGTGIKTYKKSGDPIDIADDLKSAASEAKKKCATELGIGLDIYAPYLDALTMDTVEMSDKELEEVSSDWEPKITNLKIMKDIAKLETELKKAELTKPQKKRIANLIGIRVREMQVDGVAGDLIERFESCSTAEEYEIIAREAEERLKESPANTHNTVMQVAKAARDRIGMNSTGVPTRDNE